MESGQWTWLEIVKIVSSILTPTLLAIFGLYIHRVTKRFEYSQWCSQKLIEKRLAVYDDISPIFNDILCYFTYVGPWKEFSPVQIVCLKRVADKKIHLAAPLFSEEFFTLCMNFMNLCYETYSGWGNDARLRTEFLRRKENSTIPWDNRWESAFSSTPTDPNEIRTAYMEIMKAFAKDIGVSQPFVMPHPGRIPSNIA